ncbi:D-alanyl-D-alanine carboxypeptidase family protein [Anaerocolumna sedimenticola]|uniref:D-alanyl-D-alanine carboxypeptidase family protein n=1 Tax=Anaerocolumna sedimenticola TaxID=2696063 RepID=A0A6P1TPX7_9FIRM|nr:D-alanyl-D-alanine carboxypeptidase family protein [Anaerocolumna sedimenticola]QHQ62387.1 D-alanyl-D-alanine carboxypeptidase family protein [Anaerocolumna sedimenticola]
MRTLNFDTLNIYNGNLILVNKEHPITRRDNKYAASLVSVDSRHPEILLDYIAAKELSQLINHLNADNEILPVSGYRTLSVQKQIYSDSVDENGVEFTEKYVALPNRSEHQTGLAIDLAENNGEYDFIRPYFPYSGICMQFRKKAIHYGFIERYPKGKEGITGIAHEPWHFRYVGYPHSEIMSLKNLTLEEYIKYIKNFPYKGKHLKFFNYEFTYEIFYCSLAFIQQNPLTLPANTPYQISGNNIDGFIITLRKIK